MPENVTVITEGATNDSAIVPSENTNEEMEITSEWLESLFGSLNQSMQGTQELLKQLIQNQTEMAAALQSFQARVPENLTQMIADQQTTITNLVSESMATVRSLLTPQQPQPEVIPAVENVVVADPLEAAIKPEQTKPKRVRI
jgi:hypothetical protein